MAASFSSSRLLIFGATGNIGWYITESIVRAKPSFDHVAIFTSPNTAATKTKLLDGWKSKGVSVVVGDLTNADDVVAAFKNEKPDTVISCVGRGALHTQTEIIRLANESGTVKWFFPSEYGTDIEHNAKSPNEPPHQHKLAVRKYIRENVKNMEVTYLVTGPYFDMWVNLAPGLEDAGGFDLAKKEAYLIEDGEGKIGFCTMWDVGKSMVASLRHPQQSFGKALKVQSFVVTPNEVLAEYEKQTGAKWKVTYKPLDALKALEARMYAEGKPAAALITLRRIWAEGGTLYAKNDNEAIGLKPEDMDSLETGVRRAITGSRD